MTLFGWDASHFDGPLSLAILQRARAEGIDFFTHKIGEGLQDTEGTMDDTALAAARDAGIPFVGGYLIPRSTPSAATQVARWVALADAGEPWWRSFPGWFWQIDLERWPYDNVAAAQGITCARLLGAATGRGVVLYASRGQYGDSLTGWAGPLWNADYRAGPGYPGDGWVVADKGAAAGWAPYSGQAPAILQYTSSATIAGLTTCDKNAFRGTVADFAALIGGTMANLGYQDDDGQYLCERERALMYLDKATMGPEKDATFPVVELLKRVDEGIKTLAAQRVELTIDATAAADALANKPEFLAALAKAVNDDAAKRRQGWS